MMLTYDIHLSCPIIQSCCYPFLERTRASCFVYTCAGSQIFVHLFRESLLNVIHWSTCWSKKK
uniref:Uncharacterized protein n=1 Tax=Rhizophora mucronata TaxID=61149 RepID=A0A2P2P5I6_RHIMU